MGDKPPQPHVPVTGVPEPQVYPGLVRTKLVSRIVPEGSLDRPRLIERLGVADRPLTAVVAPAGYGKSTLVAQWIKTISIPSAWLSVDDADNDPAVFLSYLVAAIEGVFPRACPNTRALINAPQLPGRAVLSDALKIDIDDVGQPFALVLDDLHRIHRLDVPDLLSDLLDNPPQGLRLVVVSRHDPPLPVARLRGRSQIVELRRRDLAATLDEAAVVVGTHLGAQATSLVVQRLHQYTEGWLAGLHLVGLAAREHADDLDDYVAHLPNLMEFAGEYLTSEVLAGQPPELRKAIVRSSILDRFSGALFDAVQGADDAVDGRTLLNTLKDRNLFVIPLGGLDGWVRYHHLFQQWLQAELRRMLPSEEILGLHRRAGRWFAGQGFVEEALEHFLEAGAVGEAAGMVAERGWGLLDRGDVARLIRWMDLLPDGVVDDNAELLIQKAWLHQIMLSPSKLTACLARAEEVVSTGDARPSAEVMGNLYTLRAWRQIMIEVDVDGALESIRRSEALLPPGECRVQGANLVIYAGGLQMKGDLAGALRHVRTRPTGGQRPSATLEFHQLGECFIQSFEGDPAAALRSAEALRRSATAAGVPEMIANAQYFMGVSAYQANDLQGARGHLEGLFEQRHVQNGISFFHGAVALALAQWAMGETSVARRTAGTIAAFAAERGIAVGQGIAEALVAEIDWREGALGSARRWAVHYQAEPFRTMARFFVPQLTLASVLIADGDDSSMDRADGLVRKLEAFAIEMHNRMVLIPTLLRRALLYAKRGESSAALEVIMRAIDEADPGRVVRPFVDAGPAVIDLMNRVPVREPHHGFLRATMGALQAQYPSSEGPVSQGSFGGIGSLTPREMEILSLIDQHLTNKEIAQRLAISGETVKKHTGSLYAKLNVDSRRRAAAKGRVLGYLRDREVLSSGKGGMPDPDS